MVYLVMWQLKENLKGTLIVPIALIAVLITWAGRMQ